LAIEEKVGRQREINNPEEDSIGKGSGFDEKKEEK